MCLLSFQHGILTWLQRRIAVAVLNVLEVVKAARNSKNIEFYVYQGLTGPGIQKY